MKYDDVEHFVVRCVGCYSSSEVKQFTPYQHKGRRPCENRPNTGVLGVLYIRSNRNDVMRHMPLFYIRTTQSSEMADAPKITFRSSVIQTDF